MDNKTGEKFDKALYGVRENLARLLGFLPHSIKEKVQEIRLRAGKPVALTIGGENFYLLKDCRISREPHHAVIATKTDLEESYRLICQNSVYSHEQELKQGFVMMKGGCRAGIAGEYSGTVAGNISSINIRIAGEVIGAADEIVKNYSGGGLLIAGAPGSGKTTVLRDFIRQISKTKRVSVIDERGEISATHGGISYNDLGVNTDILLGYPKPKGIETAIRTLFPEVIAFDEIGTEKELKGIKDCLNAGVSVITTVHAGGSGELSNRQVIKELLDTGAIKTVVLLKSPAGSGIEIFSPQEVKA